MDQINQKALQELEEYRKQGCHMMIPTTGSLEALAEGYVMTVTPVKISPDPCDGDVYPHDLKQWDDDKQAWKSNTGNERVRFHAQAYQALSDGADARWSQPEISIDPKFPRVLCSITGAVMKPDGNWRSLPDVYGSDLDIIKDELIARYSFNGKFDEKKQWMVDRELIQKRKHQKVSAVTGAKNRVTARLLRLKNTYTRKELEQPFVFVQIHFRPDMKDREVRMLVTKANLLGTALNSIFGRSPSSNDPAAIEYLAPVDAEQCRQDDDVIDMETGNGDTHYTVSKEPPDEAPPFAMSQEPTTAESLRADFLNSEIPAQVKTLDTLLSKKNLEGFALATWLKGFKTQPATLENIHQDNRSKLYDHLVQLKDKVAEGRAA